MDKWEKKAIRMGGGPVSRDEKDSLGPGSRGLELTLLCVHMSACVYEREMWGREDVC